MVREYSGVPISHDVEDVGLVQQMVAEFEPDFTVELGTMRGGMTLAIHDAYPKSPIATFDNKREYVAEVAELIANGFVVYHCWDVLSQPAVPVLRYVTNSARRKFLYCDNGNKVVECVNYARYLTSGDMLGVHDWGTEIHTDYNRMEEKWRVIVGKDKVEKLRQMIEKDFELVGEGRQTRLWIKR